MKLASIVSVISVIGAMSSSLYLGRLHPHDLPTVSVKFCPKTANVLEPNEQESQLNLNRKYCRYRYFLLEEIWKRRRVEGDLPLPENSFQIQRHPGNDSGGVWLLLSPVFAASAYISWLIKSQTEYDRKFAELENHKTNLKIITQHSRGERDFKTTAVAQNWNRKKLETGQISVDALQDKLRRQSEIQDKTHASVIKDFELHTSEVDKQIAENSAVIRESNQKAIAPGQETIKQESALEEASYLSTLDDRYKWISLLLGRSCSVITGGQGSGKSVFERWLIECLKSSGYYVIIINPETIRSGSDNVKVLNTRELINNFLSEFPSWHEARQQECRQKEIDEDDYLEYLETRTGRDTKVAIFCMEANTYKSFGIDQEKLATFYNLALSNIRKWGFQVYITAQSANQTSICDELTGFSARLNAQPRLECIATVDKIKGKEVSTGKANLMLKGTKDPDPIEVDLLFFKPKEKSIY